MQMTTKYFTLDLINLVFHPSSWSHTKWYDSNLLAGNLKKYQTMNIGYSQAINSAAYLQANLPPKPFSLSSSPLMITGTIPSSSPTLIIS